MELAELARKAMGRLLSEERSYLWLLEYAELKLQFFPLNALNLFELNDATPNKAKALRRGP